jgi:ATP-dependent RNA helicase DDX56/DBP9
LVPTRELAEQVLDHLRGLVKYCESDISIVNVAGGVTAQLQRCALTLGILFTMDTDTERLRRVMLSDRPHVVIGTPSKVLSLLRAKVIHILHRLTIV